MLHPSLHTFEIRARFQSQLQGRQHALLVEQVLSKAQTGDNIALVVLTLIDREDYTRGDERVDDKARLRIGHVELALTLRCIDLEIAFPIGSQAQGLSLGSQAQGLSQTDARRTILQVGCVELELSVAIENLGDMRQLREVVVHTFYRHHGLFAVVDGQCHVLHGTRGNALHRHNLQLRVEVCEEAGHQVMETVEHRQNDDEGHRSHSHSDDRDQGNHIDGVRFFLGEEITPRHKEWKIH